MALVRVEIAALRAVAAHLEQVPERMAAAHEQLVAARGLSANLGDAGAAADTDELLRQAAVLVDLCRQATASMARALVAATTDYAAADDLVVRFER